MSKFIKKLFLTFLFLMFSISISLIHAETPTTIIANPTTTEKLNDLLAYAKNIDVTDSQLKEYSQKVWSSDVAENDHSNMINMMNELESYLHNEKGEINKRWIAAMTMARVGGDTVSDKFIKALESPNFMVRMAAIKGIEVIGTQKPNVSKLLPYLNKSLNDPAMVVRTAAVDALGKIGERQSLSLLIRELNNQRNFYRGKSLWVREHLIDSIARIGGNESVPALVSCLREDESLIVQKVLQALNPMMDPAAASNLGKEFNTTKNSWLAWQQAAVAPFVSTTPSAPAQ
jgi:hypothetical protein